MTARQKRTTTPRWPRRIFRRDRIERGRRAVTQRADSAESELNFRFQIQPDKPGIHFYQLDTRATEELNSADSGASREATLVNNRRMLAVDRGQQPFRVLCVAGRPDWEFKFLNRALEDDPQVRMVTLLRIALREPKFAFRQRIEDEASNPLFGGFGASTNEDTARYDPPVLIACNTPTNALELRGGFPKSAEELFKYDAVILDRVEAGVFYARADAAAAAFCGSGARRRFPHARRRGDVPRRRLRRKRRLTRCCRFIWTARRTVLLAVGVQAVAHARRLAATLDAPARHRGRRAAAPGGFMRPFQVWNPILLRRQARRERAGHRFGLLPIKLIPPSSCSGSAFRLGRHA